MSDRASHKKIAAYDNEIIPLKDNEICPLRVSDINKVGAFLDWGAPKELLLPFAEIIGVIDKGQTLLIRKYTDKSGRPAASMKGIYNYLSTNSPYRSGDVVSARIYEFGHDFGTFVAVDDKYSAMIPKHESVKDLKIGDVISARVVFVKEDGKLDLSLRESKVDQIPIDSDIVLELLNSYSGVLPFTEKAEPAVILRETGLSKAAFKRAVGALYKNKLIEITSNGVIRLK